MDLKSDQTSIIRGFLTTILVFCFFSTEGQQTPLSPLSYWAFAPSLYNPAISGSKDFSSIGLLAAFQENDNTQILSGNTRFTKKTPGYFLNPTIKEYSNFGFGGSLFNDNKGLSQNMGISAAGSYHIPLGIRKLSFLSVGASLKGVYNTLDSVSLESPDLSKETFYENLDFGIYFYSAAFFAGLSGTDLLGNPEEADSLGQYSIPVEREYYFTAGYKIVLSRSLNIVLEPSILITANDSTIDNIDDNINPIIKLYLENFCVGTSFLNEGHTSLFFEFRYPRFFVGAFCELPKKTPYFKSSPLLELTAGINFTSNKIISSRYNHW